MTFTDIRTTTNPHSDSRRRGFLAAGVAALFVLMLTLAAGIALGRHSVDRPGGQPSQQQAMSAAAPSQPTGDGGTEAGVPVGWPHTRAGATGAATAFLRAVGSRAYTADSSKRRAITQAIAVPSQLDQLLGHDAGSTAPAPGDVAAAAYASSATSAWRLVPVGYRIDAYTAERAVVSVWAVQIAAGVGSANVPAQASWGTTTLPLRWVDGDWKLDVLAMTGTAGPSPASSSDNLSSDLDVIAAARGFKEYADVAR